MLNQIAFPASISPLARDFITRCLQTDPARRPSVNELKQHPWITQPVAG